MVVRYDNDIYQTTPLCPNIPSSGYMGKHIIPNATPVLSLPMKATTTH